MFNLRSSFYFLTVVVLIGITVIGIFGAYAEVASYEKNENGILFSVERSPLTGECYELVGDAVYAGIWQVDCP